MDTVTVQLLDGPRDVPVIARRGALAVTPAQCADWRNQPDEFVITHVPTGMTLWFVTLSRSQAEDALERIAADPVLAELSRLDFKGAHHRSDLAERVREHYCDALGWNE